MSWLSHGHQLMNFFVKADKQRQVCLGFALAKNKGGAHSFSLLKSGLSHHQKTESNIPSLPI